MNNIDISSLFALIESNPNEQACKNYLKQLRWRDGLYCPHCSNREEKIYEYKDGLTYKCTACNKQFSLTKGTIFERTHIPLRKWFYGIYLFLDKKSCSANYLSRQMKIAYPNAYFMLQRIRKAMGNQKEEKLTGVVEIDETFVGGKNKNRHYHKRKKGIQGRSCKDKAPVVGMVSRGGQVRLLALGNLKKKGLQLLIRNKVQAGATISTDEFINYRGLSEYFVHGACNHGAYKYVHGEYHTNTMESFWSHFKRGILGIYHYVSRKLLRFYCDEYEFRYNNRKLGLGEKFETLILQTLNIRLMRKDF